MPKVQVKQDDGEIKISTNGDEPKTYKVSDGTVTVALVDLAAFLNNVAGSKVLETPAEKSK